MIFKKYPTNRMKTILGLLGLMTGVMLLSACGEKEQERKLGVEGYVYVPRETQGYDVLGNCRGQRRDFKAAGGYLYFLDKSIYRIPVGEELDFDAKEKVVSAATLFQYEEPEIISNFTADDEGNIYYFTYKASETGISVYKRSAEGELQYRVCLDGEREVESISSKASFIAQDGKGNVYVLSADSLLRIDSEGNLTGKLILEENSTGYGTVNYLLEMSGDKVYFVADSGMDRKVYEVTDGDTPQLLPDEQAGEAAGNAMNNLYESPDGFLIMGGDGFLYQYDDNTGETEKVLRWEDSDIYYGNVTIVVPIGENRFFASVQKGNTWGEYEGLLLSRIAADELQEKEVIVMASLFPSDDLAAAVVEFNRKSEQYHVTIESYGAVIEDWEAAAVRLDGSLTTKNTPDLLDLSFGEFYDKYADKGVLEDLYQYLGEDSGIRKEDFLSNVVEGYTRDGKLLCIPQSFNLLMAYSNDPRLNEVEEWTFENLMALDEKYEDVKFLSGGRFRLAWWRKALIESIYSAYYLETYIDWEKGECSFDSEGFCSLLQWMKEQIAENTQESLLQVGYIDDFDTWESILIDCGRDTKIYGFPSADGSLACEVWTQNLIGIVADSEHKDGAWAFLQYYLQTGYQGEYNMFPTRIDQLLKRAEEIREPLYETDSNGERIVDKNGNYIILPHRRSVNGEYIEVPYMTESEAEVLLEVLKSIDFTPATIEENKVISVVLEEAESYFNGTKSAEETAGIIQNRVKLLLQENR